MITPVVRVGQIWKWSFGDNGDIYLITGLGKRGRVPALVRCFELSSGEIYHFTSVGQSNWELLIDVEPNR